MLREEKREGGADDYGNDNDAANANNDDDYEYNDNRVMDTRQIWWHIHTNMNRK